MSIMNSVFSPANKQLMLSMLSICRTDFVPPLLNHMTDSSKTFWKPPHCKLLGKDNSAEKAKQRAKINLKSYVHVIKNII